MSTTAPRKPAARLPRPAARYWKGKAPKGAGEVSSDDSDYDEAAEAQEPEEEGDVLIHDITGQGDEDEARLDVRPAQQKNKTTKGINVALRDVNISKEGKVIVAGKEESGRTQAELEEGEEHISYALHTLKGNSKRRKKRRKKRERRKRYVQLYRPSAN